VTTDQTPLDVEAIRARLDAATARDVGPDDADIDAEMDRVRSARLVLNGLAPVDLSDLLDENARLNAENERLSTLRDALCVKLGGVLTIVPQLRRIVGDGTRSEMELIDAVEVLIDKALPAAPEMPHPAAQEAQERPETTGTGSGRGTGVTEASGTAQAREEWGVRRRDGRVLSFEGRDDAEAFADGWHGGERTVVHRFIGPWEPAPTLPVPSTEEGQ
jgi:hypothetical protein